MQNDRCIFVIATGERYQWMFDITIPRLRKLAENWGVDFFCATVEHLQPGEHPCHLKQMINELFQRYRRVCYIDADIVVNPDAPNLFDIVPEGKCAAFDTNSPQVSGKLQAEYLKAYNVEMKKYKQEQLTIPLKYATRYYNAGVFLCDETCNPHRPPVCGVMSLPTSDHYDQNYFNLMINAHDIPMYNLGEEWNYSVNAHRNEPAKEMYGKAYFVHYLCRSGKERLLRDVGIMEGRETEMRVHCVMGNDQHRWILGEMWRQIAAAKPANATVTVSDTAVDEEGVINYYNPYRGYKGKTKRAKDVVFCTHPEVEPLFWDSAQEADMVVVMCDKYKRMIQAHGVPVNKVVLIHPGADARYRSCKLSVFNPALVTGRQRKGGTLWADIAALPWIEAICSDGKLSAERLYTEYLAADAIVSTATMEGGPMSLVEALQLGKPCVMPDGVGLVEEVDAPNLIKYAPGDYDSLVHALRCLYEQKQQQARYLLDWTWQAWGEAHWQVFARLTASEPRQNKAEKAVTRPTGRRHVGKVMRNVLP